MSVACTFHLVWSLSWCSLASGLGEQSPSFSDTAGQHLKRVQTSINLPIQTKQSYFSLHCMYYSNTAAKCSNVHVQGNVLRQQTIPEGVAVSNNSAPANYPAFDETVPLFYAMCPSKKSQDWQVCNTIMSRSTRTLSCLFKLALLLQCSAQVFKRAGCHSKRAHLVRWADRQKGTISMVNWRKRAQLARWTEEKGHY